LRLRRQILLAIVHVDEECKEFGDCQGSARVLVRLSELGQELLGGRSTCLRFNVRGELRGGHLTIGVGVSREETLHSLGSLGHSLLLHLRLVDVFVGEEDDELSASDAPAPICVHSFELCHVLLAHRLSSRRLFVVGLEFGERHCTVVVRINFTHESCRRSLSSRRHVRLLDSNFVLCSRHGSGQSRRVHAREDISCRSERSFAAARELRGVGKMFCKGTSAASFFPRLCLLAVHIFLIDEGLVD